MLDQPELHEFSCRECQLHVYDMQTLKPVLRNGEKQKRGRVPPPCGQCPKENPQKAAQHELSDKNWQAYQFYLRHRAMNFNALTMQEKTDPIVQRNMKIIDEVIRSHERKLQLQQTMLALSASVAQAVPKGATKR